MLDVCSTARMPTACCGTRAIAFLARPSWELLCAVVGLATSRLQLSSNTHEIPFKPTAKPQRYAQSNIGHRCQRPEHVRRKQPTPRSACIPCRESSVHLAAKTTVLVLVTSALSLLGRPNAEGTRWVPFFLVKLLFPDAWYEVLDHSRCHIFTQGPCTLAFFADETESPVESAMSEGRVACWSVSPHGFTRLNNPYPWSLFPDIFLVLQPYVPIFPSHSFRWTITLLCL